MDLSNFLFEAGHLGLRWVWAPLLLWTIVAALIHGAARWARQADPRVRYRLYVAVWWALPVGIVLSAAGLVSGWLAESSGSAALGTAASQISVGPLLGSDLVAGGGTGPLWLHVVGALTLLAGAVAALQCGRLAYGAFGLRRLRQTGRADPEIRALAKQIGETVGVSRPVEVRVSERGKGPMTFGWGRPVIMLPAGIAEEEQALRMALTHELIHIRRRDYLLSGLEQMVAALGWVYPVLPLFRRQLARVREMACDAEVLEQEGTDPRAYAELLCRMAESPTASRFHALALSDSSHNLIARLQAMTDQISSSNNSPHGWNDPRRWSLLLGGVVLIGAALVVACSEITAPSNPSATDQNVQQPATSEASSSDRTTLAGSEVDQLPELQGGISGLQQKITYPEQAAKNGTEGRVVVQFEVTTDGGVEDPRVVQGVSEPIDQEALRVIRQARFAPGRHQGEAVRVKMSLPFTFQLPDSQK